ncbi:MAG: SRPBCC family protein [Flavobacteriales bacterium]|nr:SRPBCC family protein [Flavobacteriales bacterium]|tara:strand:+ start:847 stop:1308 length:462 start_codon:yes stop_codon:yes gene_type:complete
MAHFQLIKKQFLKTDLETIWDFASSPKNLKEITPDHMLFDITSKNLPEKMYPGMIITYKVSPFLNIKMNWVTEITQVKDKHFFVDEQRMGPYSMWHHQHFFEEQDGGVMMTDIVSYIPPFGILGVLANSILIKRQLESIFDYRFKVMDKKFNN